MYYFLVSIYNWAVFLISCFIFFPINFIVWLVTYFPDPNGRIIQWISCLWASTLTWLNPLWKVRISGKENIKSRQTYVYILNHQSMLDILVSYRLFTHFKWIPKAELFKVPFVGWNMSLNRYIPVKRGSKTSHIQLLRRCEETLRKGNPIMIFPEGTRSKDGFIHTFKTGAFHIAKSAQVPIIPIVIKGTFGAFPTKGIIMKMHNSVKIKILPPIPYEQFKDLEPEMLAKQMQTLMTEQFQQL